MKKKKIKDLVEIHVSGEKRIMERDEAIIFFKMGVAMSDGSEQRRYLNLILQLESGEKVCSDGISL